MSSFFISTLFFIIVFVARCVPQLKKREYGYFSVTFVMLLASYAILILFGFDYFIPSPLRPIIVLMNNYLV